MADNDEVADLNEQSPASLPEWVRVFLSMPGVVCEKAAPVSFGIGASSEAIRKESE